MSDLLLVCTRRGPEGGARTQGDGARTQGDGALDAARNAASFSAASLRRAALHLSPPEITPHEPLVAESGGMLVAIANPQPGAARLRDGVAGAPDEPAPGAADAAASQAPPARGGALVGVLFGETDDWWRVGAPAPDGTCALARWNERAVELVSDACATRTLWYARTGDAFLASTSQRALVALLGDFELQPEAVSWMLSAGHLGPEVSWDARLRRMPPNARLTLDRASWTLDLREERLEWAPLAGDKASHGARLRAALEETCAALDVDDDRWVLPLSGGVDSRILLATLLEQGRRPRCITWTTRASLRKPLSDAFVARAVARRLGVEHEIVFLDPDPDVDGAVDRFIAADEGRNDEVMAYVDGLAMWRQLFEAGVTGILRGDEHYGTGVHNPPSHLNSRLGLGGAMVEDYPEGHVLRSLGLAAQTWPERLDPRPGEGRLHYRTRLIGQAYDAVQAAGLNGLKARYVGIANPHLSRRVLDVVYTLPTEMVRGKVALRALDQSAVRRMPTARFSSTPSMADVLASPDLLELVVAELTADRVERVLPGDGGLRVLTELVQGAGASLNAQARVKLVLKKASVVLPTAVARRLKPARRGIEPLPAPRLAFRVLLASRTVALLEEDAGALRGAREGAPAARARQAGSPPDARP